MCNKKSLYDPAGFMGGGGDQLHAKLGIGVEPEVPDVVTRDPVAEEASAQAESTKAANAAIADRKRRAKRSSLLAAGGEQGVTSSSLLAQGRKTLG